MSAAVETMMYVREVPWHGLGTRVENAPNSSDAMKLAQLDWEVEGKPIFDASGKEIPGFKANTRNTDGSVFGIVSNRYKIIQNADAFSFTDAILNNGTDEVHYETAGSLHGGRVVWLLAKMENQRILGDEISPYLVFMNTHDGKGSIKVCMSPVRVVCANTLNMALSSAVRSWTTRHVGDLQAKLDEARHTLGLAKEYMHELKIEADVLANTKLTEGEVEHLLDIAYPITATDTERKIKNMKMAKENFFTCYNMSDISQFKGTAWGVMNATSDLVTHFAPARMTNTYIENNCEKIILGHPIMDLMFSNIKAM